MAAQCPDKPSTSRGIEPEKPPSTSKTMVGEVRDILESNANPEAQKLLLAWGKVCNFV